jgi:CheY-like chemotaxis protein
MSPASHRRRVLLIEDSSDIRETLREFLQELGHEVYVASTGSEGVAKLLEARPDVAFVDVGLPEIDGYEVARRVRAAPGGEKPFLVALTGYGGPEAVGRGASAGFDLHLTKPVNVEELQNALSRSRPAPNGS